MPNQTNWSRNKTLKDSIVNTFDDEDVLYDDPAVFYDGYDTSSEAFEDAPNTNFTKQTPNQTGFTKRTPTATPWS